MVNNFIDSIKYIESEDTRLFKKYRNGEIEKNQLTTEQINSLILMYDNKISSLRKENEFRKQKLMEYRKKYMVK